MKRSTVTTVPLIAAPPNLIAATSEVAGKPIDVLLLATYEMGRQPFGVASAAAWLNRAGRRVRVGDLAVEALDLDAVRSADAIAFHVPMHTATRLAARSAERIRALNPTAHLAFFGLYAPVNRELCRQLGVDTVLGGEFEQGLVDMADRLGQAGGADNPSAQAEPVISLERQQFILPDRSQLPALGRYAFLTMPDGTTRTVGYTEASRGCKHLCRHCPVVPVYGGQFRVVARDVVLADIGQQVAAGARHITFGDPDFLNGPGHALPLVTELHERWPDLTYDVTIKVEHLLQRADKLPILRETGCVLLTSAFESFDDAVLAIYDKRHTRAGIAEVVALCRHVGLTLNPTFVAFSPWLSLAGYLDFLHSIAELGLVEHVTPIQYAIRLLIPEGSRLLELPGTHALIEPFNPEQLCYPWTHPDPRVDALQETILAIVTESQTEGLSRSVIFTRIWQATALALGDAESSVCPVTADPLAVSPIPFLSEPWYC